MDRNAWQTHIDAFSASGQSARAYCAEHGLIYHRFNYWRHKFRDESASADGFASVTVTHAAASSTLQPLGVVEFPSGIRLAIHDASLLALIADWLKR